MVLSPGRVRTSVRTTSGGLKRHGVQAVVSVGTHLLATAITVICREQLRVVSLPSKRRQLDVGALLLAGAATRTVPALSAVCTLPDGPLVRQWIGHVDGSAAAALHCLVCLQLDRPRAIRAQIPLLSVIAPQTEGRDFRTLTALAGMADSTTGAEAKSRP